MRVPMLRMLVICAAGALATACGGDSDPAGGDDKPLTPPTPQRTAKLEFSTGDEQYLVTVWSSPGISEASPAADLIYELNTGSSANSTGLSVRRARATVTSANVSAWAARLAYEQGRRDGIERLIATMQAEGRTFTRVQALRAACACGDDQTCAPGSSACTNTVDLNFQGSKRSFTVAGNVTSVNGFKVTVLTDQPAQAEGLLSIADQFAAAAKTVAQVMGQDEHSGVLDRDDSGSITVVFTNNFGSLDSSIVGVFEFGDFLDEGQSGATHNRADILWARLPGASPSVTNASLVGTLVHEYQHLASFALRSEMGTPEAVRETLWLDEGLSHTMEDLTGWGGSTVDAYAAALESWDNAPFAGPNDGGSTGLRQRGRAYMLIRYLIDEAARSKGAINAASSQVLTAARELIAPLYKQKRRGFQHALFQSARSDGRLVEQLRAVYTSGNADAALANAAEQYLPVAASPRGNDQRIGFGAYETYVNARGQQVPFGGPTVDDSNDGGVSAPIEDSLIASGARFYLITGGEGTVTLTLSADENTDINIDAVKVK